MKLRKLRQTLRFAHMFFNIIAFLAVTSCVWLITRDRWKRTRMWTAILQVWCRWAIWILKVKPNPIHRENFDKVGNALLTGNHLTHIDVITIASQVPTCFVTSVEIKNTPFLGQICQMAGCLFVERRSRKQLHEEIGEL